ncbi:MAG: 30S ribosomal protein S3 [Anaerolineaceae bacterium]|jgi:small subunit ribosomal protein S3|nr:30S ribosomal protein S3 [Anaerolineae bacterium]MDX9831680.1 30S ribosomal protein S3 [Anaerolineae bacterium]NLF14117.1 30S ribosomal protein S3 [Anaerolineaceae bacterium]
MGRKVHPYGFRLGYIYDWKARWYAERDEYAELLEEDLKLRKRIRAELGHAGISKIEIERFPRAKQVAVKIWTAKPGIVIGRKGANVNALRRSLEELTGKKVHVDVEEVERPELDAQLVAEGIAQQIERRISYKRAMKQAVQRAIRFGAEGAMVTCAGRLHGAEMARRETNREGRVPRHTLRADIDYAHAEALTTFGRIGIKVWIYKGEVLPERLVEEASTAS